MVKSALSWQVLLLVAIGGALGALSRYVVTVAGIAIAGSQYPFGTLVTNVFGSFAMGLLIGGGMTHFTLTPELRAFMAVGFLGAFTTFSTFSLDAVTLFERDRSIVAVLYVLMSVVLSIGGLAVGFLLMRR